MQILLFFDRINIFSHKHGGEKYRKVERSTSLGSLHFKKNNYGIFHTGLTKHLNPPKKIWKIWKNIVIILWPQKVV